MDAPDVHEAVKTERVMRRRLYELAETKAGSTMWPTSSRTSPRPLAVERGVTEPLYERFAITAPGAGAACRWPAL